MNTNPAPFPNLSPILAEIKITIVIIIEITMNPTKIEPSTILSFRFPCSSILSLQLKFFMPQKLLFDIFCHCNFPKTTIFCHHNFQKVSRKSLSQTIFVTNNFQKVSRKSLSQTIFVTNNFQKVSRKSLSQTIFVTTIFKKYHENHHYKQFLSPQFSKITRNKCYANSRYLTNYTKL